MICFDSVIVPRRAVPGTDTLAQDALRYRGEEYSAGSHVPRYFSGRCVHLYILTRKRVLKAYIKHNKAAWRRR